MSLISTGCNLPKSTPSRVDREGLQRVIALQDRIIDDLLREINDLKRLLNHDADVEQLHRREFQEINGGITATTNGNGSELVRRCVSPAS